MLTLQIVLPLYRQSTSPQITRRSNRYRSRCLGYVGMVLRGTLSIYRDLVWFDNTNVMKVQFVVEHMTCIHYIYEPLDIDSAMYMSALWLRSGSACGSNKRPHVSVCRARVTVSAATIPEYCWRIMLKYCIAYVIWFHNGLSMSFCRIHTYHVKCCGKFTEAFG